MKISYSYLKKISLQILESLGATSYEADLVSNVLLLADLRGIHTHGINFLPKIAKRIKKKVINIPTKLKILKDEDAITQIDGNNGFGQVAAEKGMQLSIEKAEKYGLGFSLIRNTNHIGLLAFYSLMAAKRNKIGFCACNGAPSVAPWGGAEAFFGTNPFSVAVPTGDIPIILDMSTSIVARGKIRQALNRGEKIPFGWALDSKGKPTDDPKKAMKGTLIPIGGPKGYGMALVIDLLCGLLSGSKYGKNILTFHEPLGPTGVGVMTLAIDIERFMHKEHFFRLVKNYIKEIHESKKVEGNNRIFLPGEIESEKERLSREKGLEINYSIVKEINELLSKLDISMSIEDEKK